jgi:hypothetical protein
VSPLQAAKSYRLLRTVLNSAVRDGVLAVNLCNIEGGGVERSSERPLIDAEVVSDLADAIDPRYRALILLIALGPGSRKGEFRAYRRHHIDLLHGRIRTEVQEQDGPDGTVVFAPKNDSARWTTLPPFVVEELSRHLDRYAQSGPTGYVFTGPTVGRSPPYTGTQASPRREPRSGCPKCTHMTSAMRPERSSPNRARPRTRSWRASGTAPGRQPTAASTRRRGATPSSPRSCSSPPRRPNLAVERDLTAEHLDVYSTKEGLWTPDHGAVDVPDDWDFLPSGDAFMTRTVKAAGVYWLSWDPKTRSRPHRRLRGLWAPKETIAAAQAKADETATQRAKGRESGSRQRERQEARYREELRQAIVAYLAFAPSHADLAQEIADEASGHAALVGSGRVGRTRTIALEERAALAARAYIRHRHTAYEDELDRLAFRSGWDADYMYREVKGAAHAVVDRFIKAHR